MGHASAGQTCRGRSGGFRPSRRPRRFRRDGAPGPRSLERLREYPLRLGIGAADSLGGELLRQSLVGGIVLLLSRSGSRPDGAIPRNGAAGPAVYPDQSLQRQSLLAAVGRQAQGSSTRAIGGRIYGSLQEACL